MALTGLFALQSGVDSASGATTLANTHDITIDGRTTTFEIAFDEYGLLYPDGRRERRVIAPVDSAEVMRQQAQAVEQSSGGVTWLAVYPAGKPRNADHRRYVSHDILVKLEENADPFALAANFGMTYRGSLHYMEGTHLFRTGGAGRALMLLDDVAQQPGVLEARPVFSRSNYKMYHIPNDPLFPNQWHLLNTGQMGATVGSDVNITNAWDNYLGSNIFLAVFDSGFDFDHPDLRPNMLTNMAFNPVGGDQDISARPGEFHGTAVAGVAAARGDNNEGGTGSAPLANIVPIRFAFGDLNMTTVEIAAGLLHSNNTVQVHNNSWGIDTFTDIYELDSTEEAAFQMANQFGRGGLGTIYVYSAGNAGDLGDDVNYSGFTKEMTVISVIALNDLGQRASYSTYGAAATISAPAGLDATRIQGTTTTDVQGTNGYNSSLGIPGDYADRNYTAFFNGTSSAAPLTSGVIALMLDANPNLGWRDVQEILMRSANLTDTNNAGWFTNAAGFHFNNEYGAGIVNAHGATMLSATWTNLGLRTNLVASATTLNGLVSDAAPFIHNFTFTNTEFRIEHVQLRTDITHPVRGDLQVSVTSPSGTRSLLTRLHSDFNADLDTTLNTVFNWGEIAAGTWTIEVADRRAGANGVVNDLDLTLWGTVSNAVFISLTNPPSIIHHPLSRTATKGSDVLFRVNAIGSGQLNYRWLFNGQEISGQNGAILIVNDVSTAQQGTYHVRIDNQFGTVISAGASLFVSAPPEVVAQPNTRLVNIGDSVDLNVAAIGNSPLTYQWRFNGRPLTNETSATLNLGNFQPGNAGNYDVIIRNNLSSVISDIALLSANTPVVFSGITPSVGGSAFTFNFSGNTGQVFRVDGSIDLLNWISLSTNSLNNGTSSFSDGAAGTFSNRYYRVVPLP